MQEFRKVRFHNYMFVDAFVVEVSASLGVLARLVVIFTMALSAVACAVFTFWGAVRLDRGASCWAMQRRGLSVVGPNGLAPPTSPVAAAPLFGTSDRSCMMRLHLQFRLLRLSAPGKAVEGESKPFR